MQFFIFRTIHEGHKHSVIIGGHRIHALLQSTFEVTIRACAMAVGRGTSDGFLLNVLKQLLGYLVYLEISKRRYKSCICSVILGQLESFRNYKGFSIFVPEISDEI